MPLPWEGWVIVAAGVLGVVVVISLVLVHRRRRFRCAQECIAAGSAAEHSRQQVERGRTQSPWVWYQTQTAPPGSSVQMHASIVKSIAHTRDPERPDSPGSFRTAAGSKDESVVRSAGRGRPRALSADALEHTASQERDHTLTPTSQRRRAASCASGRGLQAPSPSLCLPPALGQFSVSFTTPPMAVIPRGVEGAELPCLDAELFDWGPGLKKCSVCGRKPILNRGCLKCNVRYCEGCFLWHRIVPANVRPIPIGSPGPLSPPLRDNLSSSWLEMTMGQIGPPSFEGMWSLPADLAQNIQPSDKCKVRMVKDFYSLRGAPDGPPPTQQETMNFAENIESLRQGQGLLYFNFLKGTSCRQLDLDVSSRLFSLSAFDDEHAPAPKGNNAPHIDVHDAQQRSKYTFVVNKATYAIPAGDWTIDDLTPQLIASHFYQRVVMPSSTDVIPVHDERAQGVQWHPNTFRIRKPIIPGVFKFTCQFRCTEISPELCAELSPLLCDGLRVDRGILLERTKRDPSKHDMIAMAKSLLLYHKLDGGGLVCINITTGVATSIPWVLSTVIHKLSFLAAGDVVDTVNLTRQFFAEKYYKNCAQFPPSGYHPNNQQDY
eukprot:Hpha_TRINITY_DN16959_c0_g1::TRINITY_DN16959_c0_g1_i2::g.56575::m.56575